MGRSNNLRDCDKKENARIAAAECFSEAQKYRAKGDHRAAESLEDQGRKISKWGK
ncbi:hypothetical protein ACGFNU_23395 [Spirillospora sp. NPDC048911]|uniref:hypothetical protein n=1 Tax=Spirillospora sp. NPDC048911 TaxID=3364527 RepID=UPI003714729A